MPYTFEPPVEQTLPTILPDTDGIQFLLFRHYQPRASGRTIIIEGGVCRTATYPTQTELEAADAHYLGGHIYTVSDAEAAILQACGYTVAGLDADISGTWAHLETGIWDDWDGYAWGEVG